MAEELTVAETSSRKEKYETLLPQLKALLEGESDTIANMANFCAALQQTFRFLWIGFYLVKEDELVLGPFQGPIACTRIAKGQGVCGTCWQKAETIVVPDVDAFPGHIACSSASKSEIVVPGFNKQGNVAFVLDIDSDQLADFTQTDAQYLEQFVTLLSV